MTSLLVLNGPNLNMLGIRQPDVYGRTTLPEIEAMCREHANAREVALEIIQSNHEGALIDQIHAAHGAYDGIILNAGAYTHTSIAIMDAVASANVPTIELHLSNIHAREAFRHTSYLSKVAVGQICGFGAHGYVLAIDALIAHINEAKAP
ncbi:type II 3-dehydroquinate dehydratase [Aliiroseovarius sp. S1339]|uniref:type II 3-dehydroquinate dehydratase n=1 Tax=Aliiroseovarius sp. S1339 TaxID=2936990 RepID=UPI0020BDE40B|nr:type II 3-dehydroquinate dehydratase [Aliiroseovarius sp. S1339]MCK8463531.1 type II 3-dehydroquinate dehydratase [Aliiroseovarius sp. S1339]